MTKREWIKATTHNPCPICGKGDWCSASATNENVVTCHRHDTAPNGWVKLKPVKDGGGVFKPIHNEERPGAPQQEAVENAAIEFQPVNHQIRDRVYRRLIEKNGYLSRIYQQDLQWRGLSDQNINEAIERGWFTNWQRGIISDFGSDTENIAGINPQTGKTGSCDGNTVRLSPY